MKKQNKLLLLLTCILFTEISYADMNQNVFGQASDKEMESLKADGKTPSLYGSVEDMNSDIKKDHGQMLPGQASSKWSGNYKAKDLNVSNNSYLKVSNESILKSSYKAAKESWSFSYLYDSFTYNDRDNIFKTTFENETSAKSVQSGYFSLHRRGFFTRSESIDTFITFGGSISYNTGRGVFADDNELSRAKFNLWVLPLDLFVGTSLSLGKAISISVAGGPSLVGMIQNRSDREEFDSDKRVRQVGYGYGGYGSINFSMSQIFKGYGVSLRNNSDVTDFSISILAKVVNYSNFKNEDVEISGNSIGLGLNFDVL
jgi:hypothetical protein